MSKSSRHLESLKKEVKQELNVRRLQSNDKWNLHHIVLIVEEREDMNRIAEIVDLFRIAIQGEFAGIPEFYWWYKDNRLSEGDSEIYRVFDAVTQELRLPQADPTVFSGLGSRLIKRIEEWKGNAKNAAQDILIEYFTAIVPVAAKFNGATITSPKSLLGDFGWTLFEAYITEQYGGKQYYLSASKKDIKQRATDTTQLQLIQAERVRLLEEHNIRMYDQIGVLLSDKGIAETYQYITKLGRSI